MTKSWDVLTTKAFTRVRADRIIAFNERTRNEAIQYGDYRPEQVVVTGFPQFESYRQFPKRSREEFCKALGLDPSKKIVLFAVPGDAFAPHTSEIVAFLDSQISARQIPANLLARLHPKYRSRAETLALKNGVFDRPGTLIGDTARVEGLGGDLFSWTFSKKDVEHLADSLYYADVVIATFSTMVLDALASDKPTILIGYDGDSVVPFWQSIMRQYGREYYAYALSFGATPLVKSGDELMSALERFLADPSYLREERSRMRESLLTVCDGRVAEHMAEAILELL